MQAFFLGSGTGATRSLGGTSYEPDGGAEMSGTYSSAPVVLVLMLVASLGGRSAPSERAEPANDVASTPGGPADEWDAPDDYQFVLRSRCGERNDLGRYEIVVTDGEVTDVAAPHWERVGRELGRIGFTSDYAGDAPTLTELVAEAEAAEAAGADVVELTTDPVDRRPTRLDIDWSEGAIDDDVCFIVSDYSSAAG